MSKPLVSDELWARIEPLLPAETPRRFRFPGRKPKDRRKILTGIVFVLKTGIAWDDLPAELGWGCGRTCRETLAAWQRAGVWDRLHKILLDELGDDGLIDWSRTLIDSAASKAPKGGELTGPNPTDRRKKGSKHHVITDAQGIPLAIELTGAQRHDSTQMLPLVDAIPPIQGPRGRPRKRPDGCRVTGLTTRRRAARNCGSAGSSRRLPAAGRPTAAVWGRPVGTSRGRWPGSINAVASASGGIVDRRSNEPGCHWLAR
jgi:transposase